MKSPFQPKFFTRKSSHTPPASTTSSSSNPSTPSPASSLQEKKPKSPGRYYNNTSSTSLGIMGQANGKYELDTPPHTAGAEYFHSPLPTPEFYHAPHSAPVFGTASSGSSSKPSALSRALSQSQRRRADTSPARGPPLPPASSMPPPPPPPSAASLKALKTLGQLDVKESLRSFEALVVRAEAEAGIVHVEEDARTLRGMTRSKRSSTMASAGGSHFTAGSGMAPMHSVTPSGSVTASATPPGLRPTPHRRSSTSSIHSSRTSIKSARRAEREWRAKVAALSSGFSPSKDSSSGSGGAGGSGTVGSRGPVPPRRNLARLGQGSVKRTGTPTRSPLAASHITASAAATAASSPTIPTILAPSPSPSLEPTAAPTPGLLPFPALERTRTNGAKSIVGRKSFETLGHYIHLAAGEGHERQVSVPYSVSASSLRTDRTEVTGRVRQESVAASTLLALESAGEGVVVEEPEEEGEEKGEENGEEEPVKETDEVKEERAPTPTPAEKKPVPTQLALSSLPTRTAASPLAEAPCSTPVRTTPSSEPTTPYSPTTAYILSAPSIELAWQSEAFMLPRTKSGGVGAGVPGLDEPKTPVHTRHPFTLGTQDSPTPPTPPNKSPAPPPPPKPSAVPADRAIPRLWADQSTPRLIPTRQVPTPPAQAPSPTPTSVLKKKPSLPVTSSSGPLQPRRTQTAPNTYSHAHSHSFAYSQPAGSAKKNLLGSKEKNAPMKRYGNGAKGAMDLTPGMESGQRPPKSGLPRSDLERWLAGTSISA
ncbi:hypothetical protein IAT38_004194 [Cryptococcus sp. DSM 104549]